MIPRHDPRVDGGMEGALEAGAEDFKAGEDGFEILPEPASFESVHQHLEKKVFKHEVAEITAIPTVTGPVSERVASNVAKLIDVLEEHDHVKEVHSNGELPEGPAP